MATTVQDKSVVSIHYVLTDDEGNELDSSNGETPMLYLHGVGQLVPGLELALEGLKAGDTCNVTVSPEDGYGEFDPDLLMEVPRDEFPDDADLEPGMQFAAENEDGEFHVFSVLEMDDDVVKVDGNHPLASKTLHFQVEIVDVRAATDDELEHGHAHGEGGHHHHH